MNKINEDIVKRVVIESLEVLRDMEILSNRRKYPSYYFSGKRRK